MYVQCEHTLENLFNDKVYCKEVQVVSSMEVLTAPAKSKTYTLL